MPKVSILIPAFRPDFLDLSISSALGQSEADFELIISDDSEGTDVESVVSKWSDRRIRFVKNPNRGAPGANRDHLISLASGKYLKFLHDDDLLLPEALERMTASAEASGAALVFIGWYVVDHLGRLCHSNGFAEEGEERLLSGEEFFEDLIAESDNFIGGPSNILLDSEALSAIANPFSLDRFRLRYLTDVALFTNIVHRGLKVAAVGGFGTAYRRHRGQYSGQGLAGSAALVEWELLLRWSAEHGHLTSDRYRQAVAPEQRHYLEHVDQYPELAAVIELAGRRGSDGRYMSDEFIAAIGTVHHQVDVRLARYFEEGPIEGGRELASQLASGLNAIQEAIAPIREDLARIHEDLAPIHEDLAPIRGDLARLETGRREAEARAEARTLELEQLRSTRIFRYTAFPRRLYASLRRGARPGRE